MIRKPILVACFPVFALAANLFAGDGCGPVTGSVRDLLGYPLAGTRIVISAEGSADGPQATSDAEGSFRFASVPCGTVQLTGEMHGFRGESRTLILSPGDGLHVALGMVLGDLADPPKAHLRGTVRWDDGSTVRLAQVTLMPSMNPRLLQQTRTSLLGGYDFTISHGGQFLIHVRTGGPCSQTVLANLIPGQGDRTIDIVIPRIRCALDLP